MGGVYIPLLLLNLYCLVMILVEGELRTREFALVIIQAVTEFFYKGLLGLSNMLFSIHAVYTDTCRFQQSFQSDSKFPLANLSRVIWFSPPVLAALHIWIEQKLRTHRQ